MNSHPSEESVIKKVHDALGLLLKKDIDLLYIDVAERTIAARLAAYLQSLFPEWHVDVEYNRDGHNPKKIMLPYHQDFNPDNTSNPTVSPDIIVHRRRTDNNLLVIEIKKSSNKNTDEFKFDIVKLEGYKKYLHYRVALFIIINTDSSLGMPYYLQEIHN
jgi:hypothetical protein